jgi:hypothetical protein
LWRTSGGGMGERGTSAEVVLALEDKVLRLLPYKEPVDFLFSDFSNGFDFNEFCRVRDFEFLNFVLRKNLEMDSSFLDFLLHFSLF